MIALIAVLAPNYALGYRQQLLWKISEDLQYFKRTTQGHTIIMGRKTYESLGRPLPNRRNIIISKTLAPEDCLGVELATSLEDALTKAGAQAPVESEDKPVFIIGGGEIYRQALPLAQRLYITWVQAPTPEADTFFPPIDPALWKEIQREDHACGKEFPHPFSFVVYTSVKDI
jgi:Dihydrofolate reductase